MTKLTHFNSFSFSSLLRVVVLNALDYSQKENSNNVEEGEDDDGGHN